MLRGTGKVALLVAAIAGCSSSSTNELATTCEVGETRSCVGPAQCKGGQVCGGDGKWGACACGGGGTGGAAGGGAGGTPSGGSGGAPSGGSGGTGTGGAGGGVAGPATGYLLWGKDAGELAIVPVDASGLTGEPANGNVPGCTPRALVRDGTTNALYLFCTTSSGANVYFVNPTTLIVETSNVTPLSKTGLVVTGFDWVGGGSYHALWQPPVGASGATLEQYVQGVGSSDASMSPPTGQRGTFLDAKKEFVLWSSAGACVRTSYVGPGYTDTTLAGFANMLCRSLVPDGSVWRMAWGAEANDGAKVCTFAAEPADAVVPSGSGWTAGTCKDFSYSGSDWRFRGYLPKP